MVDYRAYSKEFVGLHIFWWGSKNGDRGEHEPIWGLAPAGSRDKAFSQGVRGTWFSGDRKFSRGPGSQPDPIVEVPDPKLEVLDPKLEVPDPKFPKIRGAGSQISKN